jgi:polar amino acid transport system substrate-binding protein
MRICWRYLLLLGCVGLFFYSSIVWAQTIRFVTIDYCPFTCDPSKEAGKEGFMTDVLREAFEPAGYTLEIEMLPYVRAVNSVRAGLYDGIVVVGKDYAPDLVYPDEPTVKQRVVFLVRAGTSWRYRGVESLAEAKVGIVRGFHYVDPDLITYLAEAQADEAKVHVIHGDSTTRRGLRMLFANRITTLLEGEYSATYELEKMRLNGNVMVAGYTENAFEDYTGFSPRNSNAAKYAEILSDTLAKMKESGRLDDILRRYGITSGPRP